MFCRRMYHFLHLAARVNLGGTPLRYSKGRADQICRTRSLHKTKKGTFIHDERPPVSGRLDLNQRPPAPEAGALTGLRYAPRQGPET